MSHLFFKPESFSFLSFLLSSLVLSDTNFYEPQTRALLGTATLFCEVLVLEPRTVRFKPNLRRRELP